MDVQSRRNAVKSYGTPLYIFNKDAFEARCNEVATAFSEVGLCFSVKANPFLIGSEPDCISHLEVCSPGELDICVSLGVDMAKIIFSGVNKREYEIEYALRQGVRTLTAESLKHLKAIERCSAKLGVVPEVLIRLAASTQFGMDEIAVRDTICRLHEYSHLNITGLHYFTGTMKKKPALIEKELNYLCDFADSLYEDYGYKVLKLEYGTGLAADYFGKQPDDTDYELLNSVAPLVNAAAERYSLTVEMGRFFAAPCGKYYTTVDDVKNNNGISFAICDGGIHQLHYDGQLQGMQIPELTVIEPQSTTEEHWTLCGSLCTTADILTKNAPLTGVGEGAVIEFGRCGAYSVNEGISTLLSRELPAVALYSQAEGTTLVRPLTQTAELNTPCVPNIKNNDIYIS